MEQQAVIATGYMDAFTGSSAVDLQEVRRLMAERSVKKAELDALDHALENLLGINDRDRPKKPRLSRQQIRAACNVQP